MFISYCGHPVFLVEFGDHCHGYVLSHAPWFHMPLSHIQGAKLIINFVTPCFSGRVYVTGDHHHDTASIRNVNGLYNCESCLMPFGFLCHLDMMSKMQGAKLIISFCVTLLFRQGVCNRRSST